MSTESNDDRIKEIELELAGKRERLEFHKNNLRSMQNDPDMIDAATRENGRINTLLEEIAQLEEKRALQGK